MLGKVCLNRVRVALICPISSEADRLQWVGPWLGSRRGLHPCLVPKWLWDVAILHHSCFSPRDVQGPMVSCGDCGRFDVKKYQAQGPGQGGCLVNMSCSWAQSLFGRRATNRTDAHLATWICSKINLEEWRQGVIVFPHGEGCSQSRTGCVLHCLAQGSVLNLLICFDAQRTS